MLIIEYWTSINSKKKKKKRRLHTIDNKENIVFSQIYKIYFFVSFRRCEVLRNPKIKILATGSCICVCVCYQHKSKPSYSKKIKFGISEFLYSGVLIFKHI